MTLADRVKGCLLGGALGDALGGRSTPNSRLCISDDTQFTLATCESILERGAVDPEHIADRFAEWFRAGRLSGLGSSSLKALRDLDAGVHWALAGARGEYAAGNGAAMRIGPLAFLLDPRSDSDRVLIRDVCRITHHNDEAYVGALAVLEAIRLQVQDEDWHEPHLLERVYRRLPDSAVRDRVGELAALKLAPPDAAERFGASGYVVETAPLALLCAQYYGEAGIQAALAKTVDLGGDADTIASICGQIVGTRKGAVELAQGSLSEIQEIDLILRVGNDFAAFLSDRRAL